MADKPFDPRTTPWEIKEREFERLSTFEQKARFLVGCAVLAPSGHNTQPWKFGIGDGVVKVYADYKRRLPVADADDRELKMSVGAAVTNLRVAAARFGFTSTVAYPGDGREADLLCEVHLSTGEADSSLAGLFPAITIRRTNRFPYDSKPLSDEDTAALRSLAMDRSSLKLVTAADVKEKLSGLVARGDRIRMADRAFAVELAEWMRPNGGGHQDGITADALGIPGALAGVVNWAMRHFDMGRSSAKKDARLVREAAAAVVITGRDEDESLLDAGQLLGRFLLKATSLGICYSYFNLTVEVPELREEIRSLLGIEDLPQLLLRAGYAAAPDFRSPRRPVDSVLMD